MKTCTKQDFHNPEQLTRQQVGYEHRLLLPEEADGRFAYGRGVSAQCTCESNFGTKIWVRAEFASCSNTYRVPLATPLPDGTVLSSNECCWSDESSASVIPNLWGDTLDELVPPKDTRKVVYCCGPMTGIENFNFDSFYKACAKLESQGYKAINPAALDSESGYPLVRLQSLTPDEFQVFLKGAMKRDLDALQQCDAIALLPGWESSKGARAEKAVAEWLGLEVMYLDGAECSSDGAGVFGTSGHGDPVGVDSAAWENAIDSGFIEAAIANIKSLEESGKPYYIDKSLSGKVTGAGFAPDDPKGAAGALKAPWHLLPPDALTEVAEVMGEGARKYGPWNFVEARVCASTYIGAIGRHWSQFAKGIDIDIGPGGSGKSHLSHIAANCLILLTAKQQGTLNDDRPKLK